MSDPQTAKQHSDQPNDDHHQPRCSWPEPVRGLASSEALQTEDMLTQGAVGTGKAEDNKQLAESLEVCLEEAVALKTTGTQAFRAGEFQVAAQKYTEAFLYLGTQASLLDDCTPKEFKSYVSFRVSLLLNAAIAAIKAAQIVQKSSVRQELGRMAMDHCAKVLEPKNVPPDWTRGGTLESFRELSDADRAKAFYQRALAQSLTEDDEVGMKNLVEAIQLGPDDHTIKKSSKDVCSRLRSARQKLDLPGTQTDPEAIMFSNVIQFILNRLALHHQENRSDSESSKAELRPLFVGIQGAQGVGKTTITRKIATKLRAEPYNLNLITLSLDDLYLTHGDQVAIQDLYPENYFLRGRGVAGTHDLPLAINLFRSLEEINSCLPTRPIQVPRYDKLACDGLGDREKLETFQFDHPVHVVILEGWMVGFQPFPSAELNDLLKKNTQDVGSNQIYTRRKPSLTEVPRPLKTYLVGHEPKFLLQINQLLQPYQDELWSRLDVLIQLEPTDLDYIKPWRTEAEVQLKAQTGKRGMLEEQIEAFLMRYMPHYELYSHRISIRPDSPTPFNVMEINFNKARVPIKMMITSDLELSKRCVFSP